MTTLESAPGVVASRPVVAALARRTEARHGWWAACAVLAAAFAAIGWLFSEAVLGAVRVWHDSATFNHCFLVIPIVAYVIWDRRERLAALSPAPEWLALILIPPLALFWLLGWIASVLEAQQFAVLGLVQVLLLTVLGRQIYWALLFPFLYLFFLVPSGEWLVPYLQDWTAWFVVAGLRALSIPVYSDGVFISIPAADFEVAEACAGIRFLIASIAFGFLYANLMLRAPMRRTAFVLLSVTVPILANWLRALGIVLIAHWSDAKYAVGVDHLVYGWFFFTLVTMGLIGVGYLMRDRGPVSERVVVPRAGRWPAHPATVAAAGLAAVVLSAGAPVYAAWLDAVPPKVDLAALALPKPGNGWELVENSGDRWRPRLVGADRVLNGTYRKDGRQVHVWVAFYTHQRPGSKAVSSVNRISEDDAWQRAGSFASMLKVSGHELPLTGNRLVEGGAKRAAWSWYWIGGAQTGSAVTAKLQQARKTLLEDRRSAAAIAIAADYQIDPAEARATVQAFLDANPSIGRQLDRATAH